MPFASIASFGSLFKNPQCTMEFGTKWGEGEIFNWCQKAFKDSRAINKLEIRITREAIPHRFVVAYLQDGPIWRFDRRPRTLLSVFVPGSADPQGPDEEPPHRAVDEACLVTEADLTEIESLTHWEIRLDLPGAEADIFLIIAACFAIAQDKKARNYTLREYNCYFFSWTIVMLVTRHLLPFTVPPLTAIQPHVSARLVEISATIGDRITEALLHINLSAVTALDTITTINPNQSLSNQASASYGLLRQYLETQLHFGLKRKLEQQVYSQLEALLFPILPSLHTSNTGCAREHIMLVDLFEHQLWVNQLAEDLWRSCGGILWNNSLAAISQAYGDVQQDVVRQGFCYLLPSRLLKYHPLSENLIQFNQIWNEGLQAALPAARRAGHEQYRPGMTYRDMFDLAFSAGIAASLQAAQDVVRRTRLELTDPERDEMWEFVWSGWNDVWESVRIVTRDKVAGLVESALVDLVEWVVEGIVKGLGKVQGTIRVKRRQKPGLQNEAELSPEAFQLAIKQFIQSVPGQTPEYRANIQEAMSNAWDVLRKTYKPLNKVAG